jgi:hypothetical protein
VCVFVSRTRESEYTKDGSASKSKVRVKVPEYGSKFPSTGQLLTIKVHKGSRVQVEVPEYKSRFPSTDFEKNRGKSPTFLKFRKMILIFIIMLVDLPCPMGHMI